MVDEVKTVSRKIHFFKVNHDNFEWLMDAINKLTWDDMYSNLVTWARDICLQYRDKKWDYFYWKIISNRRTDVPQKSKRGNKEPVDLWLEENEWLAEWTHFLYIPAHKIIACEYNHFWARATSIEKHANTLIHKGCLDEDFERVFTSMIINREIIKNLEKMKVIKSVTIAVSTENLWRAKEFDRHLWDALESASHIWNTKYVELALKPQKMSKSQFLYVDESRKWFIDRVKQMLWIWPVTEAFDKFKIIWFEDEVEWLSTIDLMKNKIESEVKVIKLWNTRSIDSEDMYLKLKQAYTNKKSTLLANTSEW